MGKKGIAGKIVHWSRDEYGEVAVADDDGVRSLYFGGVLQTSIALDQPGTLIEDYSRAMMSSLIFMNNPRSVLLIGLGGGSLVHFLLRAFPGCRVDVVEIRKRVIDVARDFFLLPQNPNLGIFHASGEDFILDRNNRSAGYDLIMIDAFDEEGPAIPLLGEDFLGMCRAGLTQEGLLVMNLWCRPKDDFPSVYEVLRQAFGNNTLRLLPGEAYWNGIVLGSKNHDVFLDLLSYRPAAGELRMKYGIDFPKYLKLLYWQNFR
jgi:spermidine synthase